MNAFICIYFLVIALIPNKEQCFSNQIIYIIMNTNIDFTRVNRDYYGNPRVVCHFMDFINDRDELEADEMEQKGYNRILHLLNVALKKAHKIGGKKYRGKEYGGGIVFQCYNENNLSKRINEIKEN